MAGPGCGQRRGGRCRDRRGRRAGQQTRGETQCSRLPGRHFHGALVLHRHRARRVARGRGRPLAGERRVFRLGGDKHLVLACRARPSRARLATADNQGLVTMGAVEPDMHDWSPGNGRGRKGEKGPTDGPREGLGEYFSDRHSPGYRFFFGQRRLSLPIDRCNNNPFREIPEVRSRRPPPPDRCAASRSAARPPRSRRRGWSGRRCAGRRDRPGGRRRRRTTSWPRPGSAACGRAG